MGQSHARNESGRMDRQNASMGSLSPETGAAVVVRHDHSAASAGDLDRPLATL